MLTPHANVLLALDADPDTKLVDLADDTQVSYRWMVKITSELLDAGYLDRTRHGRTYRYEVTCPGESDLIDPRAARVHQLSHVLASSTRVVPPEEPVAEDRSVVLADSATTTLAAELEHLRYEVVLETQRLRQIQAESRHLEAAIERARSALREPVT